MKKEIIEKYKNDEIIKICIEMIDKISKIKKEEDETNEGSLTEKEYQGLIINILSLIESRITFIDFWGHIK